MPGLPVISEIAELLAVMQEAPTRRRIMWREQSEQPHKDIYSPCVIDAGPGEAGLFDGGEPIAWIAKASAALAMLDPINPCGGRHIEAQVYDGSPLRSGRRYAFDFVLPAHPEAYAWATLYGPSDDDDIPF